jgi:hypothetical protein
VKTALYLALFEGKEWKDVDPKLILGPQFSTLSGWQNNVNVAIQFANFLCDVTSCYVLGAIG